MNFLQSNMLNHDRLIDNKQSPHISISGRGSVCRAGTKRLFIGAFAEKKMKFCLPGIYVEKADTVANTNNTKTGL